MNEEYHYCKDCQAPIQQRSGKGRGNWRHFCATCRKRRLRASNIRSYALHHEHWQSLQNRRRKGNRERQRAERSSGPAAESA